MTHKEVITAFQLLKSKCVDLRRQNDRYKKYYHGMEILRNRSLEKEDYEDEEQEEES
jgi:hypothetical protein